MPRTCVSHNLFELTRVERTRARLSAPAGEAKTPKEAFTLPPHAHADVRRVGGRCRCPVGADGVALPIRIGPGVFFWAWRGEKEKREGVWRRGEQGKGRFKRWSVACAGAAVQAVARTTTTHCGRRVRTCRVAETMLSAELFLLQSTAQSVWVGSTKCLISSSNHTPKKASNSGSAEQQDINMTRFSLSRSWSAASSSPRHRTPARKSTIYHLCYHCHHHHFLHLPRG